MADEDRLLTQLKELGLNQQNYRVLALLPLVLTAWADGKVQPAELEKLREIAGERGFLPYGASRIFEEWVTSRPTDEYVDKCLPVLIELARRRRGAGADLAAVDLYELADLSLEIAAVAGGLFGQAFTVSAAERRVVNELAELLNIDDGQSWKELLEDLG
jgi:hypothetical protein